MIEPRLFLCSGASIDDVVSGVGSRRVITLDALGDHANITLKVEDVARVFLRQLSPRLIDLLEIAAYVFTADAGTRRGSQWQSGALEPWSRDFEFVIPVRDPAFWNREDVRALLVRNLQFLSDDNFAFNFVLLRQDRPFQQYLELSVHEQWAFRGVSRVLLFSGGLDSLAGAVETASSGENVIAVSHRSVTTMSSRQRRLFHELRRAFPSVQMLHIPVWLNKHVRLGQEPSQRTRSFWYGALGTVVASSVEAAGVRFFENGVVSLNLPVAGEALRARASRTTHPETLRGFEGLFSLVLERGLVFDNPFLLKTKADVVTTIVDHGAGDLIGLTVSCAHPMFKSKSQQHCGMCSQCIDRRIAVIAAGASELDPATDYERDVFLGTRPDGYERNMGVNYARHAAELSSLSEAGFAQQFSLELTRAVRDSPRSGDMAQRIIETHRRHAEAVCHVLQTEIERNAAGLSAHSRPRVGTAESALRIKPDRSRP